MKSIKYVLLVYFVAIALSACNDEYVYNTRVVNDIEFVGTNEDGCLLFSKGETDSVRIKMLPVDATDKAVYSFVYESSDANVFTVDSEGIIHAIAPGEAILNVYAVNNVSVTRTCKIVIQPNWIRTIELPQDYRNYNLLVGNTVDLGSVVTIQPEVVDDPTLNYISSNPDIATVDANGVVTGLATGDVEIMIQAADGGGAMTSAFISVMEELHGDFPRSEWEVTASHQYVPDTGGTGAPEDILDGLYSTFLSIRKPGKGSETPAGATIFFTIDLKQAFPFNYFKWHHRSTNTVTGLRASEVDLLGSNDGVDFEEIQTGIALDVNANATVGEKILLDKKVTYRYVRFVITGYSSSSSAVQISEVYIGND